MSEDRNASCAERIAEHSNGRVGDFRALTDAADAASWTDVNVPALEGLDIITSANVPGHYCQEDREAELTIDDLNERAREAIYEYPLAVSTSRVWRIDLSTGGPADWLEVIERDGEPEVIRYHFADWFDHAEIRLEGDDFDAADRFARALTADYFVDGAE